jgi:hypothetical protein
MPISFKLTPLMAAALVAVFGAAKASDLSDVARQLSLPIPVVETVLSNVDTYYASADAPANLQTSGIVKGLALKAVKDRMGSLADSTPGKSSDATDEERNATYKAVIRTTRHETSESAECVDNTATVSASEAMPVIKDGAFTFDAAHPKLTSHSWPMTFCRTPLNGGSDFSDWQLK